MPNHLLFLPPFATLWQKDNQLLIIFGFVIVLALIRRIFRHQREKMWHVTARLALEKGQPVPPPPTSYGFGGFARWGAWWEIRRGLMLLAVSLGLYLALDPDGRAWVAIPAAIGAVNLVMGLFSMSRSEPPSSVRDPGQGM